MLAAEPAVAATGIGDDHHGTGLRGCDATAAARVNSALPAQFRDEPTATPSR
ncbi:hypothetical protein [Streptomyces chiangmaiensis]|uniref:Uncharacterized protein n=1 Tax=Streptomyces chiangmaiensis TaxID=766497 RepID=A0ABU7FTI4_9ACTN|nr:hypothetical protein [Streptomyces chiangmaiensis]MED7827382.1 hypothetical protein [Streptomyces chiangmaiensis]